eukprot:CAMPEP_0117607736 /NCGR_PEP_ID=MMETSP0784-20121206/80437_1 /TAXON_ID=39447 /ORGANISM="" /LENGTH=84 /DNA_ID=CAMNT_0005410969 /DNA_START=206 /DNA_END=457 /DNA_ORIENTATION=+
MKRRFPMRSAIRPPSAAPTAPSETTAKAATDAVVLLSAAASLPAPSSKHASRKAPIHAQPPNSSMLCPQYDIVTNCQLEVLNME